MTLRFAGVAYTTAFLFCLVPLLDILTLGVPARFGEPAWRFGVIGASSNYLLTFLFGVVLAGWTAAWYGHRRTLRVLAVLSALLGVLVLAIVGEFVLDVVQLRPLVPPADHTAFQVGSAKALVKFLGIALGLFALAFTGWRGSRRA